MQGICRFSWILCLYEIENEIIKFRCEKRIVHALQKMLHERFFVSYETKII